MNTNQHAQLLHCVAVSEREPQMKKTTMRTTIAASFALLALGACGSSKSTAGSHDMGAMGSGSTAAATTAASKTAASPAAATAGAIFKDADVTFAQGMIPHHEQAIEMADMALDPGAGAGAAIKALAAKIKAGQDPEIKQLKALLTSWGKPLAMDAAGGHDMASMDGMMSAKDMTSLGTMKGAQFDKMWATLMISHHQGAIKMAQAVKAGGSNPDALKLADAIITAQQAEIGQLTPIAA